MRAMDESIAARLRGTAGRLLAQSHLASLQASLDAAGLHGGDRVVLVMDNTAAHAGLLLLLVERGVTPVLMSAEATAAECATQVAAVGAHSIIALGDRLELALSPTGQDAPSPASTSDSAGPGIFLLTSGSTGRPSRVFRPLDTWIFEARRYCALLHLQPQHVVLLAAPLAHAYVLGWLWAAVESACTVEVSRPNELGAIVSALRSRATHCALTPSQASLLSRRAAPAARPVQLQVVMAGAGPVDAVLEERFMGVFGLGLSRNYGSTESGALCAGLAPLPPLSLGALMPHLRLVDAPDAGSREAFPLSVELEDGRIYRTGDLARYSDGGLLLIGREGSAIRRGDRWVSPFEIESLLKTHPDVLDCSVRAVASSRPGNDHIFASVVLQHGRSFDAGGLRAFCSSYLSRSKVPDRFERVATIPRNAQGKPAASKVYRSADPAALLEAAMAYKRAHLLFALHEHGVLAGLDSGHSVDRIAYERGLHAGTLARTLELAHWLGLVEPRDADPADGAAAPRATALSAGVHRILELESLLDTTLNSIAGLGEVLRNGHLETAPGAGARVPGLPPLYQQAMSGAHKVLAMRSIMREFQAEAGATRIKVLDVSATGGGYTEWLREHKRLDVDGSARLQVGGLTSAAPGPVRDLTLEEFGTGGPVFDLLVLDNATHHDDVVQQLPALVARLARGGRMIVDEIFIEPGSAAVGVDWLTHGGLCLLTESDLLREFAALGFEPVARIRIPSPVLHRVFLFRQKD